MNANPRWSHSSPFSPGKVTEAIAGPLEGASLSRVLPENDIPTWLSPCGATSTIDHFLLPQGTAGSALGSGIIPPNQFALFPSSSPADLLRVVHDMALLRWDKGQEFWFVADDVRHAYGSVGHTTCHSSLLAAGVDEGLASLVVSAAKWIKIQYAGPTPAMPVHARFDGGTGQGDP